MDATSLVGAFPDRAVPYALEGWMPRNVEIKARVGDLAAVQARAQRLAGSQGEVLIQEDTFFQTADGRLKLRVVPDGKGELIANPRNSAHALRMRSVTRT